MFVGWSRYLLKEDDPVLPEAVSALMGFAGVAVFGGWQLIYTLPRFDELVVQQIAAHGGHTGAILGAYAALTLASLVHAVTFYHLVGRIGSVTAGVMKGCQATAVFVAAHALFCGTQPTQCFTPSKAWSLVLVVSGTVTYAISQLEQNKKSANRNPGEPRISESIDGDEEDYRLWSNMVEDGPLTGRKLPSFLKLPGLERPVSR